MEIERKFLMKEIPKELDCYPHYGIEQAYVTTDPVIRIRKKALYKDGGTAPSSHQYVLTVKGSGLLARQEFELSIEESAYEHLIEKTEGNLIAKTRYQIPLEENLMLELDVFHGLFDGLILGEIEFPDEQKAKSYPVPAFAKQEVTYDPRFHNNTMSSMTQNEIAVFLQSIQ